MFLLSIIPDFVIHLLVLVGVLGMIASFFFEFIPFVSQYKLPIKIISIIVLVFGVYFEGGIANDQRWQLKVSEAQQQVLKAEAQAEEANRKLVESLLKRDQDIKYITQSNVKKLKELSSQLDQQCKVSPQVVDVLNNAAKNRKDAK